MLGLLWLTGINLRTVILGVPPTLPTLHRVLGLSYSAGGLLTSLPVLVMALGAIPGAFLSSRVGPRQAVTYGLALLTIGAALRAAIPSALVLFVFTVVFALGIAVSQPALPSLAQAWFPRRIGRAIATYSNGLLVGEVIAATITLPILLLHLGWQAALAAWAIPAAVVFLLWLTFTPQAGGRLAVPAAWIPDWRNAWTLRLGLLMGGASLVYFGMNIWIPDTLDARHARDLIPLTLGVLNLAQLPVSAVLAVFGDPMVGRRWPYGLAGAACLVGVAGYAMAPPATAPLWAGMVGAGSCLAFILTLGLPALLPPSEVARTSGFMFTIGYGSAFFGPALGGVAWDLTGHFLFALTPMGLAALAMLALGTTLPRPAVSPSTRPASSG